MRRGVQRRDCNRIRLFSGGAASGPDVDVRARSERGEDSLAQEVEVCGLAEERGVVGGEAVCECGQGNAGPIGQQVVAVLMEGREAELANQAAKPGGDKSLFVLTKGKAEGAVRDIGNAEKVLLMQYRKGILVYRLRICLETQRHL